MHAVFSCHDPKDRCETTQMFTQSLYATETLHVYALSDAKMVLCLCFYVQKTRYLVKVSFIIRTDANKTPSYIK